MYIRPYPFIYIPIINIIPLEFGVLLTELTLSEDQPVALRQMTAVLLRQYVDVHWNSGAEKYEPPETTPEAKAAIRKMLPEGLKESISKVGRSKLRFSSY